MDDGLSPTTIERGYESGLDVALDHAVSRSRPLSTVGVAPVVTTALTAVRDPTIRQHVSDDVRQVVETLDASDDFDPSRQVKVVSRVGNALGTTELVPGVVLNSSPVLENMPRSLSNCGVALLSESVTVQKPGGSVGDRDSVTLSADVEDFSERLSLQERERDETEKRVAALADAGCRFLVTSRAVNDRVNTVLANHGILALSQVDDEDVGRLARATGASVVANLRQVDAETLGTGSVEVTRAAGRDMTVVRSSEHDVWTLFCRAPESASAETFERSVEAALSATAFARTDGAVVPGGGSIEASAATAVRRSSRSMADREQVAMQAFAAALTVIPRTIARNAGMDPAETLADLRTSHADGRECRGIEAYLSDVVDVYRDEPIVDPIRLKEATWRGATELAVKLARIDAMLPATDLDADSTA
jgi:chaperonin GroEL (HSP60 family)